MGRRTWLPAVGLAIAVVGCGGDGGGSDRARDGAPSPSRSGRGAIQASASFEASLGEESARFEFPQSRIVPSRLNWTPQVPVDLHAADADDPISAEFTLSGRVKKGKQRTSDAVVLGLNIELASSSALFISDDGTCTLTVDELSRTRISGSFDCDAEYGDEPLRAEGTFEAS